MNPAKPLASKSPSKGDEIDRPVIWSHTRGMLTTKDLENFQEFLESGAWADAFSHADEELRLEMIAKAEALLDCADVADRILGEVLFSKDGMPQPGQSSSSLEKKE